MNVAPPSFAGWVGVARGDITPPEAIYARNWGASRHDTAEGVHRPLTLSAVTVQSAPEVPPLVLIAADLGWWKDVQDELRVRDGVREALGLEAANCLICLSHTHAGPSVGRADAAKPGGEHIERYLEEIRATAIRVAQAARAAAVPAVWEWRQGRCDLATNRDLPDPSRPRRIVGCHPASPADDTLLVGRISDRQGRVVATVVNYACHPTTLAWDNRLISPDYVGALREVVETETRAPCVFLQGASGELAPAEQYTGDTAVADAHGRRLGHAVLATLAGLPPAGMRLAFAGVVESGAPLAIWRREPAEPSVALAAETIGIELALKPLPSLAEIEQAQRACVDRLEKERWARKRAVRLTVGPGETYRAAIWCWRIGDALIVAHAHEAYSAFQTELRRRLAPRPVVAINVANGYASYLPPRALYAEDAYAVNVTPFAAGSLERMIEAAASAGERIFGAAARGVPGEGVR